MAIASLAPRKRSEQPLRWLLGAVRTALGWAAIGLTTLLPLSHWAEIAAGSCALLIAAYVLCVSAGFGLLVWGADAVRDRG